ncbi:MAG: BatA and WFA domain-containing protein [Planctomycetota bacterium]|nr:BatA and WFA domain-containing protein [Planctomycetota bacterium]
MGALNPWFLAAGIAVAVPIFLHLFQRPQTRRLSFPALRYLVRTEREHARQIRLRQLLLLLARVAILLLVVGAGARLVFLGRGGSHPATAVVIILDNSMSSGLVVGETRVLEELKALAGRTLDGASDEDRFWVIRAGEPWLPAIPGGPAEARIAVDETETSAAAGDLTAALKRAADLLRTSDLVEREIHLLSDLQRSAFDVLAGDPSGAIPVVAWTRATDPPVNRALTGVVVGGGLPPLAGQRTELTVRSMEGGEDTTRMPIRVIVNGRIRGAASMLGGAEASIALPTTGSGWVQGYADTDPDALRADDRRFFAYRSRPAPTVSVGGDPGVFVTEALAVLETAGRTQTSSPATAELLIAQEGVGLDQRGPTGAVMVIPPDDPPLLPALNRRLVDAGVPWRYEPRLDSGEAELTGESLPEALRGTRVLRWFELTLVGDPAAPTRWVAEVAGGPWAVEGTDASGRRYLLLASSMTPSATTLPVSTGMLRFVDWAASEWAGAGGAAVEYIAGTHLPAPQDATHVRFPSGREVEIDGTRTVRGTGEAGFYTFVAADTTVAILALNPPAQESLLATLERRDFEAAIGSDVTAVTRAEAWPRAVYRSRQGPDLWWPFLLAAGVLLMAESMMATSGRRDVRRSDSPHAPALTSDAVS